MASPALAQERTADIRLPEMRLDAAVRLLSKQSGASIGFRDPALAGVRVKAVRGKLTAGAALERALRGTSARARQVASATYLIERAPVLARPAPRPAPPPRAAPPPSGPEEPVEVVVTATKRDIPLGAYPGGVQIINGDSLSAADGLQGTGAIETRIASVVSTHLGPGRNKLFVRGIADSSFVGPTQATVGQYWGNSRITYSAPDPNLRLYDVQSIEVLEGPQGTLYGAGSLGGVVRIVPRAPNLRTSESAAWGGVTGVQHGQPSIDGGAIVNVPLVDDRLAFRGLAFGSVEGGYIDDLGRGLRDVNRVRTIGGRGALRFDAGDGWLLDLTGVGQKIRGDDSQYAERGAGDLARVSSIAQPFRSDYWLADLVVRKRWDDLELTSSLGYARQYVFEMFEGQALTDVGMPDVQPSASAPGTGYSQANRVSMLTFETRLARRGPDGTGWLLAASLLRNNARVERRMDIAPTLAPALPGGTVSNGSATAGRDYVWSMAIFQPMTGVTNKVNEATLYGEATFEPMPRVTLTLGSRLTHASLSGQSQDVLEALAYRKDPGARGSRSETRFLPSAALAWRPDDRLTLFARFQQGFRPGGIAIRQDYVQRFEGDRVTTLEAGSRYIGDRFDLALSGSWTNWKHIQADLIDGFGFPTTANIGDGEVFSLGVAGRWRPVPGLEIDASIYLNDSSVTRRDVILLPIDAPSIPADRLPNVADATGRLGFAYTTELRSGATFKLDGHARYVGQSTLGVGPILERLQGDYFDTGLEARIGNARRGISLTLTNLLDSRGNRFALGSPFLIRDRDQITPLRPRSIRIGFDLNF
ncbi:TonB-dependent receptor domain-containing protein [Sphingomonas koreensis]